MEMSTSPSDSRRASRPARDATDLPELSVGRVVADDGNAATFARHQQQQPGRSSTHMSAHEDRQPLNGGPAPGVSLAPPSVAPPAADVAGSLSAKALVEAAMSGVRDDVRSLHIEVLRQAHMNQAEQQQLLGRLLANQEVVLARLEALEGRVQGLAAGGLKGGGPAMGLF